MIDFAAGQSTATFTVPIVDHGVNGLPKTIQLSLFGPATYPGKIGFGDPPQAAPPRAPRPSPAPPSACRAPRPAATRSPGPASSSITRARRPTTPAVTPRS